MHCLRQVERGLERGQFSTAIRESVPLNELIEPFLTLFSAAHALPVALRSLKLVSQKSCSLRDIVWINR